MSYYPLISIMPKATGIDPDAQAFITAASITDPTQQSAINQLVVDLKGYGIWTKFSALYPMVGGTSTSTSYNLKNTAQFQISWNGGVTWGVNGVNGNGINGWGNTGFSFNGTTALSSHISTYIRTNSTTLACEFGSGNSVGTEECFIVRNGSTYLNNQCDAQTGRLNPSVADARGLILNSRTANNSWKTYRNGSSLATGTNTNSYTGGSSYILNLFRRGGLGTNDLYSTKQCAFASIGDGLTDTEAANFYTAVQAFQTTLGRSIGTQTVSDADAQAFVTNAGIVDQVEANAINNLVIGLKADGLWTKMKAVYPFVGGTATTNKFNLVNPLDTDAAFRLVFNGGWTFSSTGATPNGTNGYADTKFKVETNTTQFNNSYGIYSRTNNVSSTFLWGMWDGGANFHMHYVNNYQFYSKDKAIIYSAQPTTKLMLATRRSQTDFQAYRDGVSLGTNTTSAWTFGSDFNMYLGARNAAGTAQTFMPHELAFAFFADSLTNSEAINLTTAVNNFELALNRNV